MAPTKINPSGRTGEGRIMGYMTVAVDVWAVAESVAAVVSAVCAVVTAVTAIMATVFAYRQFENRKLEPASMADIDGIFDKSSEAKASEEPAEGRGGKWRFRVVLADWLALLSDCVRPVGGVGGKKKR